MTPPLDPFTVKIELALLDKEAPKHDCEDDVIGRGELIEKSSWRAVVVVVVVVAVADELDANLGGTFSPIGVSSSVSNRGLELLCMLTGGGDGSTVKAIGLVLLRVSTNWKIL